MNTIRFYTEANGRVPFDEWLGRMKDSRAKLAIDRRVRDMSKGSFGDCKPIRDGVWELRIHVGPGYRAYYAKAGSAVVLLLCGGDKRKQQADINKACAYWKDWRARDKEEGGT